MVGICKVKWKIKCWVGFACDFGIRDEGEGFLFRGYG